ncbi:uncharacterized protein K452DRAFT_106883 [Aplosporella prunicola CBS 121167]|uniref:Uncharacterized protein n=1 Tax=Aplosporella prunicola CBS 121167 TaxID=1176127 RepID=A0A6A6BPW4_9PEZI|nr:uncharacterized protein K452DRAFT_106883 [Aplosporella prunicola CBS 121167]KAF2146162.1 hypothetical protein K452DRAFT_106883 [Aplosporella prunicola CBS 121167]
MYLTINSFPTGARRRAQALEALTSFRPHNKHATAQTLHKKTSRLAHKTTKLPDSRLRLPQFVKSVYARQRRRREALLVMFLRLLPSFAASLGSIRTCIGFRATMEHCQRLGSSPLEDTGDFWRWVISTTFCYFRGRLSSLTGRRRGQHARDRGLPYHLAQGL